MYSGRQPAITPLTATLHTVARRLSGRSTPSSSRPGAVGEAQELRDALGGRRHDRQAVAPVVLVEEAVDLVEAAREDDVARARARRRAAPRAAAPRSGSRSPRRPSPRPCSRRSSSDALHVDVARARARRADSAARDRSASWPPGRRKPSHTSDAVGTPARSATALARNTAGVQLPQQAIPEMTASTPSASQPVRQLGEHPLLVAAVGGAELVVARRSGRPGSGARAPPRGSGRSRRRGRDRPRAGRWSCRRAWTGAGRRRSPAPSWPRAAIPPGRSRVRPIRSCARLPVDGAEDSIGGPSASGDIDRARGRGSSFAR